MKTEFLQGAVKKVIPWFRAHKTPAPWREDPTPYKVWVSEIMLQQTRIAAATPYFLRFVSELPCVNALAEVSTDRLYKLWEGLGYYSRARNLKKTAEILVEGYGGKLPENAETLASLPGIGDYTAGAIASIAYGKPEPAVDGNVLRVFSRLTALEEDVMKTSVKKAVKSALKEVYPAGKDAGDLTQGLMELGETVCLPNAAPLCDACPLSSFCAAHANGKETNYPVKSPKKERRVETLAVYIVKKGDRYALIRRGEEGLLASMWEFPNEPETNGREPNGGGRYEIKKRALIAETKHVFSHVEWKMLVFEAECENVPGAQFFTAKEIEDAIGLPTAFKKVWEIAKIRAGEPKGKEGV